MENVHIGKQAWSYLPITRNNITVSKCMVVAHEEVGDVHMVSLFFPKERAVMFYSCDFLHETKKQAEKNKISYSAFFDQVVENLSDEEKQALNARENLEESLNYFTKLMGDTDEE